VFNLLNICIAGLTNDKYMNKILRRVFILIKHAIFRVKSKVMRDDDE
jgi:hypothetical protein